MARDGQGDAYIIKRQSDAGRLRRLAFQEFVSARNSGRMVAFVGSFASKHLGYTSWKDMAEQFLARNRATAGRSDYIFDDLGKLLLDEDSYASNIDVMDLAELLAGIDRHSSPARYKEARAEFAEGFKLSGKDEPDRLDVGRALFETLGLTRFLTLNYDLELEWQIFLTSAERVKHASDDRSAVWERLVVPSEGESTRMTRMIPGRGQVTSDVVTKEDSAQLIEFALSSPDLHSRILHMHGRVDSADSLLVTRRDYRDRYWQSGFAKLPFEYAMRLIFAGNPIFFVGIGGTEADVMRVLEQFLSDNPNRRAVPMFMLWSSGGTQAEDDTRRLLFYRKFGIHMLFDHEIVARVGADQDYQDALKGHGGPKTDQGKAYRLARPLELLAKIAEDERSGLTWAEGDFRRAQAKYEGAGNRSTRFHDKVGDEPAQSFRVDIWKHQRPGQNPAPQAIASPRPTVPPSRLPDDWRKHDITAPTLDVALSMGQPVKAIIGEPGSGRGSIVGAIGAAFEAHYKAIDKGRVVILNGSFATETDSIFAILSGAFDQETAQQQEVSRATSIGLLVKTLRTIADAGGLTKFMEIRARAGAEALALRAAEAQPSLFLDEQVREQLPDAADPEHGTLTLVINGMERFIGHDGSALSNELDMLLRLVIATESKAPDEGGDPDAGEEPGPHLLNVVLIGTKRLLRYLDVIAPRRFNQIELGRADGYTFVNLGLHEYAVQCSCYFESIATEVGKFEANALRVPAGNREASARRREFFAQLFDHVFPARIGVTEPELAFELLRILAYIGQPTEQHVLYHVPLLWQHAATGDQPAPTDQTADEYRAAASRIDVAVRELQTLGLVLAIDPFPSGKGARIGLHKTVIAELRERYGVPMSDSRIANSFNLSLFAAQPVDTYTPDAKWHQEIGKLVDYLIGAYRDGHTLPPALEAAAKTVRKTLGQDPTMTRFALDAGDGERLGHFAHPEVADCLRAALSVLRSYYSVPALLMHSNRDVDPWTRDGPLSEHADRIMRLLRMGEQVAQARRLVGKHVAEADLGPPPFYPDDLVWLYNELATVRLTQGSLYDARRGLARAKRINDKFVERGDRQQNWRRIELNRLQIEIDRGRIERAEECIRDLESVVEAQAKLFSTHFAKQWPTARDYIVAEYGSEHGDGRPRRVDPHCPTDLILTIALTQGYRAICQHLRGALEASERSFRTALLMLLNLDEQRAYAFFQRHAAAVKARMADLDGAEAALKRCISAAGHARQADIDHSGRISLVQYGIAERTGRQAEVARTAIPQLNETLRYATSSDMYRLQIEAMQNLAFVHLRNGDTDSAIRFATDALSVATRCGFGLRKVSLRILLGRILGYRGALDDARELFRSASLIASKLHYEQAVEAAENARIELGPGASASVKPQA